MNIARDFTYSAIWMLYGSALMLIGFWKTLGIPALAGDRAARAHGGQGLFLRHLGAGARLSHRRVYRAGRILLAVSFFYQRSRVKSRRLTSPCDV